MGHVCVVLGSWIESERLVESIFRYTNPSVHVLDDIVVGDSGSVTIEAGNILRRGEDIDACSRDPDAIQLFGVLEVFPGYSSQ